MIPISDANPTRRVPIATWALIAINVLVFLLELTLPPRQLDRLILTWGAAPTSVLFALAHPLQAPLTIWATLVTSQFLHAGWAHIAGNMLFLWVFGDNVEDALGHWSYLIFYLVSGVAAVITQSVVIGPTRIPSIGASGAIAGVLGAYIVLYPLKRISIWLPIFLFWTVDLPALFVIGWWFIQQFFYGIGSLTLTTPSGIAFWAHVGGFVAGMLMILPFVGRVRDRPRIQRSYYGSTDGYPFP